MKMNLKKLLIVSSLGVFSVASYADFTIINNSSSYITAKTPASPCSSWYGDVPPHSAPLTIPQWGVNIYCRDFMGGCDITVFADRNCAANPIATAHVSGTATDSYVDGNINQMSKNYHINKISHDTVSIEDGPASHPSLMETLFNSMSLR